MGSKPIPLYANIFMASIDIKIKRAYNKIQILHTCSTKTFLDDFFLLLNGPTKMFHTIFEEIDKIHPTIKFTMSHTSIPNETKKINMTAHNKIQFHSLM